MGQELNDKIDETPETPTNPTPSVETLERDTNLTFLYLMRQAVLAERINGYEQIKLNRAAKVGFAEHHYINQTLTTDDDIKAIIVILLERRDKQQLDFQRLHLANNCEEKFSTATSTDTLKSTLINLKLTWLRSAKTAWRSGQEVSYFEFLNKIIDLYIEFYQAIFHVHTTLYNEIKDVLRDLNAIFNDYLNIAIYSGKNTQEHAEDFSIKLMPIFSEIQAIGKLKSLDIDEHIRVKREYSLEFLKFRFNEIKCENFVKDMFEWCSSSTPTLTKSSSVTVTPETPTARKVSKRAVGGLVMLGLVTVGVLTLAAIFSLPILWGVLGLVASVAAISVGVFAYYHRKVNHASVMLTPGVELRDVVSEKRFGTDLNLLSMMTITPGTDLASQSSRKNVEDNNKITQGGVRHASQPQETKEERTTLQEAPRPS